MPKIISYRWIRFIVTVWATTMSLYFSRTDISHACGISYTWQKKRTRGVFHVLYNLPRSPIKHLAWMNVFLQYIRENFFTSLARRKQNNFSYIQMISLSLSPSVEEIQCIVKLSNYFYSVLIMYTIYTVCII